MDNYVPRLGNYKISQKKSPLMLSKIYLHVTPCLHTLYHVVSPLYQCIIHVIQCPLI